MKTLTIAIIVILCCHHSVSSNIINGYLRDKLILEKEIQKLFALHNEAIRHKNSVQIEKKLRKLIKDYARISSKYFETEKLIQDIHTIDPELYRAVSKVTNAVGTMTQVYVRYTDRSSKDIRHLFEGQFRAFGYTCVIQDKKNENVCTSYFGSNTINVIVCKGCDEQFVLAHEFGHVLYIVPNLKEYVAFSTDQDNCSDIISHTGHSAYDPSNPMVKSVEDSFYKKYRDYLNRSKNHNSTEMKQVSKE